MDGPIVHEKPTCEPPNDHEDVTGCTSHKKLSESYTGSAVLHSNTRTITNGTKCTYRTEILTCIGPATQNTTNPAPKPKSTHNSKPPKRKSSSKSKRKKDKALSGSLTKVQRGRRAPSSSSSSLTPEPDLLFDPLLDRSYSRTVKPWRVGTHWSPTTGRLTDHPPTELGLWGSWGPYGTEHERRRSSRTSSSTGCKDLADQRPRFFDAPNWSNVGPSENRDRIQSADLRQLGKWQSSEESRLSKNSRRLSSRSRNRSRKLSSPAEAVIAVESSDSLCQNCGLSRLHLQNICFHCKQPRCTNSSQIDFAVNKFSSREADNTEFLQAAAKGLGEFAKLSSDEDSVGRAEKTSPSSPQSVQNGSVQNNHVGRPSPAKNNGSASSRIQPASDEPKQELPVPINVTGDTRALSYSGSSMSESSNKRPSTGTTHRPKLPSTLKAYMRNGDSAESGKEAASVESGTEQSPNAGEAEEMVAQLQMRSIATRSPMHPQPTRPAPLSSLTLEDNEVAKTLKNADRNQGLNTRLWAILHQRNTSVPRGPDRKTSNATDGSAVAQLRSFSANRSSNPVQSPDDVTPRAKTPKQLSSQETREKANAGGTNGWGPANTQSASSSESSSARYGSRQMDRTKTAAKLSLQRRMAYDPHASIGPKSARDSPASKHKNSQAIPMNGSAHRGGRRRLTAPVEKSDCLAAIEIAQAQENATAGDGVQTKLPSQNGPTASSNGRVNGHTDGVGDPSRNHHSRSRSVHGHIITKSSRLVTKDTNPEAGSTGRTSSVTQQFGRSQFSQRDHIRPVSMNQNRTERPDSLNSCSEAAADQPYPDMAVETLRYKLEKVTELVVRLRNRMERDFAEHGTCSPGDDVFGDEAVGATVHGQPTGMHPVVAASLKSLRVLEFNVQEIFNLLYPAEVDVWEPARACLTGAINSEFEYNEAMGKITEKLAELVQMNTNRTCEVHSEQT